jgi:acyl-lipid omega-3 desaturase
MYHNHIDKDYSHPWYTPERLARDDESLARMLHSSGLGDILRFLFPFYGWGIYIYGMPDGSHLIPFPEQRMWKESAASEHTKCLISLVNWIVWAAGIYMACGKDMYTLGFYYIAPWFFFSWWLVSVTYLQHHDPDTLVYDDDDWKFVDAAFETVDRKYGFGIDWLHHHITDGHVAHHLFFTKIPHYNLPIATKAIKQYLNENNLGWMYKSDNTWDFVFRTHKYFLDFGFKSHRAPKGGAVAARAQMMEKKQR